ncbi:MAG: CBS domain-containing protein [Armatimonadota bacterium]|nr:CBS domain-containing protein [bacterium]
MNVNEIMTTDLVTCNPNETLTQAAAKLQDADIGACPVVVQDSLVGIVTDRDITVRAVAKGFDPNSTHISDVMSKNLVTGTPSMPVEDACRLMEDNQVRRLPIVDNQGKLVGIVAQADLALDLDEEEMIAEVVEKISEPSI